MTHLTRRFVGSLSRREPPPEDVAWVEAQLLAPELELWWQMPVADRRHSIEVARRFASMGEWARDEMAGALLHDIGKLQSRLGTCGRVAATLVGPRTKRFRLYFDHESIGADMLTAAGSAPATTYLLLGIGRAAPSLRAADDV
jgi:putative nucleotidyltransferase with HDIG domain